MNMIVCFLYKNNIATVKSLTVEPYRVVLLEDSFLNQNLERKVIF